MPIGTKQCQLSFHYIPGVNFQPWVGPEFEMQNSRPRLLILGESHYDDSEPSPDDYLFTNSVMYSLFDRNCNDQFFTNIVATCLGEVPESEIKRRFWDSVAFYNYVQEFTPGPRQRPPYEAWARSHSAFRNVLLAIKPELILILGKQNCDRIVAADQEGEKLQTGPEEFRDTWWYETGPRSRALAFHVLHPSFGYSWRKFHPLFAEACAMVAAARQLS